ncbi:MAG TPA: uracil-DNA glycosylase [Chthoniobacteraceae bacterium]|nr:uracil-DNA glycosylase [Chthoniobacteraceae bacterium]
MTPFDTALQLVEEKLRDLQARGVSLRAANTHVARLRLAVAREAAPVVATSRITEAAHGTDANEAQIISISSSDKETRLAALRAAVQACVRCAHLVRSRTQVVVGVGDPCAPVMFVGEAPGEDEDRQGEPFVGRAGQLLTKIIEAMGFRRSEVYIANVLKCRPDMPPGATGNRKPRLDEMQTCLPYLREQIRIVEPRVLVALGSTAMEGLLGETQPMARLRGRWHEFAGIPLMATYHPAYLLRNQAPQEKRKVWEDMLQVLERLGREVSEKQRNYFRERNVS